MKYFPENLSYLNKSVIDSIENFLKVIDKNLSNEVYSIYLVGSSAFEKLASNSSDIDIIIILNELSSESYTKLKKILEFFKSDLDISFLSKESLISRKLSFQFSSLALVQTLQEGVWLYGHNLDLKTELAHVDNKEFLQSFALVDFFHIVISICNMSKPPAFNVDNFIKQHEDSPKILSTLFLLYYNIKSDPTHELFITRSSFRNLNFEKRSKSLPDFVWDIIFDYEYNTLNNPNQVFEFLKACIADLTNKDINKILTKVQDLYFSNTKTDPVLITSIYALDSVDEQTLNNNWLNLYTDWIVWIKTKLII